MNIKYTETDQRELGLIQNLWEKLNMHHKARSRNFKKHFKNTTFEARNKNLLEKLKDGKLRIDLATDTDTGKQVGYCVSTIADGKGEIDSLYVEEAYRHAGIGYKLIKKGLAWLEKMQAKDIIIAVADGNEEAFGFYAKSGFYPRVTILKRKTNL